MGEHLERAKAIAHNAAATTDVWVKLVTLQGLIAEIETLHAALEIAGQINAGNGPAQSVGEVLKRRKPTLVKPEKGDGGAE